MKINNYYNLYSIIFITLAVSSFFLGFLIGENSAGGGTFRGDAKHTWSNLQNFLNNDLITGIHITTSLDPEMYVSNRTPLLYILHKLFNPFVYNKEVFLRSVFFISLSLPVLFFLCLKEKFKKHENLLLILITSTVLLSPYFRTSAFWGREENFGLITMLASFIFLSQFLANKESLFKSYIQLFLSVFFSSVTLYFDQKLVIVPLICFIQIILCNKHFKFKIFSSILYFIFSLPYIYLISIWGHIIPNREAMQREIGSQLYLEHLGYATTILAFYLFPLLFFKGENIFKLIKNFFLEKKNYYLISLFIIYLLYLIFFHYTKEVYPGYNPNLGKGFIHKIANLFFEQSYLKKIFIYFSFLVSWIIILIYTNNNFKDKLIVFYFLLFSIIAWPIFQEYFDPLIILMAFTYFSTKLIINYKNSIFLYLYLSALLIFSNIYYFNLLN